MNQILLILTLVTLDFESFGLDFEPSTDKNYKL